jgi:hypothetical protein
MRFAATAGDPVRGQCSGITISSPPKAVDDLPSRVCDRCADELHTRIEGVAATNSSIKQSFAVVAVDYSVLPGTIFGNWMTSHRRSPFRMRPDRHLEAQALTGRSTARRVAFYPPSSRRTRGRMREAELARRRSFGGRTTRSTSASRSDELLP